MDSEIKSLIDKRIHQLDDEHEKLVRAYQAYAQSAGPVEKPKVGFFKRFIRWIS
jgi:hypothetical protein